MKKIFISTGDISGDIHGANLVREIKKLAQVEVTALGGNSLAQVVDKLLFDLVSKDVHGFWEPIKQYFSLKDIFYHIKPAINKVDAVILIDYYGFNIHLAEYSHSLCKPVFYYIAPQIWATRPYRIHKIKKYVTQMLVVLPFEEEIYQKENIPVTFVGHPLLDMLPENTTYYKDKKLIGLFPGSRKQVINWNISNMLSAAKKIHSADKEMQFILFGRTELLQYYEKLLNKIALPVQCILSDRDYAIRQKLSLCITTSGTVSLENALLGIPMIVTYKLPLIMYFLIKSMIKVKYVSIVNIITQNELIPELIQFNATPENIAQIALSWLSNTEQLLTISNNLKKLRPLFGKRGVSKRVAKIILEKI